jgi:hypothetical protein
VLGVATKDLGGGGFGILNEGFSMPVIIFLPDLVAMKDDHEKCELEGISRIEMQVLDMSNDPKGVTFEKESR